MLFVKLNGRLATTLARTLPVAVAALPCCNKECSTHIRSGENGSLSLNRLLTHSSAKMTPPATCKLSTHHLHYRCLLRHFLQQCCGILAEKVVVHKPKLTIVHLLRTPTSGASAALRCQHAHKRTAMEESERHVKSLRT